MSETPRAWESLLRAPYPCDHLVQVYVDDQVLIRALSHFVGSGLRRGEAAVVIATPDHVAALTARLAGVGVTAGKSGQGAFVAIDAQRCLDAFMREGMPDRDAFRATVTPVLDRLRDAGYPRIRLFGEMVNLLWRQQLEATVRLEQLWNEVVAEYQTCLLCAYRIDPLDAIIARGLLHQIIPCHTRSFSEVADDVEGLAADDSSRYGLSMRQPSSRATAGDRRRPRRRSA